MLYAFQQYPWVQLNFGFDARSTYEVMGSTPGLAYVFTYGF